MSTPTMTKAPLVAAYGMSMNMGEMNVARIKNNAIKKEVRPERPPSAMPDALST